MTPIIRFSACVTLCLFSTTVVADLSLSGSSITFNDGSVQSTAAHHYTQVIVIPSEGTDTENGTDLLNAVASITGASTSNRFLIQLEPGIYDLQSDDLDMKQYVDLRGAGPDATTVTSDGGRTLTLADDSEVRDVALVQDSNTSSVAYATSSVEGSLYNVSMTNLATSGTNDALLVVGATVSCFKVTISVEGTNVSGRNAGIVLDDGILTCANSVIEARNAYTAVGIRVARGSIATLKLAEINADGTNEGLGIEMAALGDTPETIVYSSIIAGGTPLFLGNNTFSAASTAIAGGSSSGLASATFVGCFDENFAPITDTLSSVSP